MELVMNPDNDLASPAAPGTSAPAAAPNPDTATLDLVIGSQRLSLEFDLPQGSAWLVNQYGAAALDTYADHLESWGLSHLQPALDDLLQDFMAKRTATLADAIYGRLREFADGRVFTVADACPGFDSMPLALQAKVTEALASLLDGGPSEAAQTPEPASPALPVAVESPVAARDPGDQQLCNQLADTILKTIASDTTGKTGTLASWYPGLEGLAFTDKLAVARRVAAGADRAGILIVSKNRASVYASKAAMLANAEKPVPEVRTPREALALAKLIMARIAADDTGRVAPLHEWYPEWRMLSRHAQSMVGICVRKHHAAYGVVQGKAVANALCYGSDPARQLERIYQETVARIAAETRSIAKPLRLWCDCWDRLPLSARMDMEERLAKLGDDSRGVVIVAHDKYRWYTSETALTTHGNGYKLHHTDTDGIRFVVEHVLKTLRGVKQEEAVPIASTVFGWYALSYRTRMSVSMLVNSRIKAGNSGVKVADRKHDGSACYYGESA